MQEEHFKLNSVAEVELFSKRLETYEKGKLGHSLQFIDLISAFNKLQNYQEGGRLFKALLDLKLSMVMLNINMTKAGGICAIA